MRLRIGMLLDAYDDSKNGTVISTKRFAQGLKEKGHKVIFLTTGQPAAEKFLFKELKIPLLNSMIQQMKTPLAKPSRQKLNQILDNIDILHVHFPFFLGATAIKMARQKKIPIVATFHVQAEHILKNIKLNRPFMVNFVYQLFLKYIYSQANVVICPSKFARKELLHYGLKRPSVIISNGIPDYFQPMQVIRPKAWEKRFLIISVGRLAPEKRQALIIQAVQRSEYAGKIQLLIFGEGTLKTKLQRLGNQLPNPVVFQSVSSKELVAYYNMADLYVHTAEVEVECMAAMEAMACGTTLLIANSPKSATKQFALDDRSLFQAGNIHDLRQKIDYWITHTLERKKMEQQYLKAAQTYTHHHSLKKLETLYLEIFGKS